jgi:predicted transcriptional regulator
MVTQVMAEEIEQLAKASDRSVSAEVRCALREYVRRQLAAAE